MARKQTKAACSTMIESLEERRMFSTYGTVNISLTAITPSVVVDYTRNGVDQSWGAGEFIWSRNQNNPGTYNNKNYATQMQTFCIEPDQDVVDQVAHYTVTDMTGKDGPLSALKAGEISQLWARYHDSAVADTTGVKTAAFQMAIWEIVCDSDLNMSTGTFSVDSTTATDVAVKNTAQQMLNSLSWCGPHANLLALTSCTDQDQIFEVGCIPPPVCITHQSDCQTPYHCVFSCRNICDTHDQDHDCGHDNCSGHDNDCGDDHDHGGGCH